jgi:transcriptional regulator with XRE-family HTH domain
MATTTLEELTNRVRIRRELPPPSARRLLRTAAGVSLRDVGQVVGVSHEAVRMWESGERTPRGRNLERYADVLRAFRDVLPADVLMPGPETRKAAH